MLSKKHSSKKAFERQKKKDGTPNPKYADVLDVDKPIAGQAFGCFSFISPDKIIKQREQYYFEEFLKQWEMNKSMEKFHQFLNFISYKYKLQFEEVMKDFDVFIEEEREEIIKSSIENDYKTFLDRNEDKMEKTYNTAHNFQTSVRGFKARGNFSSLEEAEFRAKILREADPMFDIFVGPVGTWLPWDPEAYKTGRVEYMEEELNQLVHEKKKNEDIAKNAFEQRVKETKQRAIDENKKNAEKYGTSVTQDIDNEGNLVDAQTSANSFNANNANNITTIEDVHNTLFEDQNVVIGKSDYGQSQLKSGPFANKK